MAHRQHVGVSAAGDLLLTLTLAGYGTSRRRIRLFEHNPRLRLG